MNAKIHIHISHIIRKRRNNYFCIFLRARHWRFLALDSRRVSAFVTDKRTIDIYVRYRLSVPKINARFIRDDNKVGKELNRESNSIGLTVSLNSHRRNRYNII